MAIIQSGATTTLWTIDTTSTAGRVTLYDQYGTAMSDINSLSNVLNALNSNVTIVLGGQATIGINVGSTSGTLTLSFEATIDDITWFAISATPVAGGSTITSTTANGQWVASTSGYYAVRTRISAFTSGSMTVSVVVTPGQSKTGAQAITSAGALSIEITDASADGPAAVKNASTAAVATDPALVVAISPNNSIAITAASLPLPTNASTAASQATIISNQTTIGIQTTEINDGTHTATIKAASTAAATTDTAIVVAVSPNNTIAVTQSGTWTNTVTQATAANLNATVTQGPANTAANSWPVEVTDGTNILGTQAHPFIIDTVADTMPATQNITAQDVGSTSTAVANGQNFITGSPTAGSTAVYACSTDETIKIMVSGSWTGTLTTEISLDSGTTWVASDVHQTGSPYTTNSFTNNFIGGLNVSGCTNFRVRATAAWTGTATTRIVVSDQTNSVYVASPTALRDGVTQSNLGTIKAASTQSLTTDTALVVALSPGSAQTRAATTTVAGVASSASSVTILASNTARVGAIITNSSTSILYLRYSSSAAAISSGNYTVSVAVTLGTHEVYAGYTGTITGIWASANGFANVTEISTP